MIEDREDRDVDEATARPWYASMGVGGQRHVTTGGGLNAAGIATCFGEADAALIVEAVNAYDRLRRIEEAARELTVRMPVDTRLAALRAALSEVPSDAR